MAIRNIIYIYVVLGIIYLGKSKDTNLETAPNISRAGDLLGSIMIYVMTTSSLNYDSYFFSPALRAFKMQEITAGGLKESYDNFINFMSKDFKVVQHAPEFIFSDTETKGQFLERFLKYLKSSDEITENLKQAIGQLEPYVTHNGYSEDPRGFIKPCPIYLFLRIATLIGELNFSLSKILDDQHLDSVETIIAFLITDFRPSVHGKGLNLNEGDVMDILNTLMLGFSQDGSDKNKPLVLVDGTVAAKKNKEFFTYIFPTVDEDVKNAIDIILPYL